MYRYLLPLACSIVISGCATVFTGTTQSIRLDALDEENQKELSQTKCSIIDASGATYHLASNPGTVVVSKGKGPLSVKCSRMGYENYTGAINSNFNAITLLDILFWPTFFVDYGTGAMQKYPGSYTVMMKEEI